MEDWTASCVQDPAGRIGRRTRWELSVSAVCLEVEFGPKTSNGRAQVYGQLDLLKAELGREAQKRRRCVKPAWEVSSWEVSSWDMVVDRGSGPFPGVNLGAITHQLFDLGQGS